MDHGGLFDGHAESYGACYAKHAAHRFERWQSKPGDSSKTNVLTIAEWTDGSWFVIRSVCVARITG